VNLQIPTDIGAIHFIGIGGIGMSGMAEILHNMGYQITGSDMAENANIKRLAGMGVQISIPNDRRNICLNTAVVVKSTAVPLSNPEVIEAKLLGIPVVRRSFMLKELTRLKPTIAIAGTHGKTTTTSLVAHILHHTGEDPTIINGGIINSIASNARLGGGKWLVAEADESDGTFVDILATAGVITNIDKEHLDYWGNFENLKNAFLNFVQNLPFYGFAVCCLDNANMASMLENISDTKIFTYGCENQEADFLATDFNFARIDGNENESINENKNEEANKTAGGLNNMALNNRASVTHIADVAYNIRVKANIAKKLNIEEIIEDVRLPIYGFHNILNSMAAIITCLQIGINIEEIKAALRSFEGVKRRFTKMGEFKIGQSKNGESKKGESMNFEVIDDYAHHPAEIVKTLEAARQKMDASNLAEVAGSSSKIIAVMQPHRYSRLENLFAEFLQAFQMADKIFITPIYAAGEKPVAGLTNDYFASQLRKSGHDAESVENLADLKNLLEKMQENTNINSKEQKGIMLFMGAGDITKWASDIVNV